MHSGSRWIVHPTFDFALFIASPLVAAAFYGIYSLTGGSLDPENTRTLTFFLFFTALFDAPHIFQTVSRTHFDPVERSRQRGLIWLLPVAAISISFLSDHLGFVDEFFVLLSLYGAWHIVKQNMGFLRLYQRMNSKFEPVSHRWEPSILIVGLVYFYFHHEGSAREILGNQAERVFNSEWFLVSQEMSFWVFVFSIVAFGWNNIQCRVRTGGVNVPKLLLMFSSLFLIVWLTFLEVSPLMLLALSTIGHNIQYQAWMWHYQSKRSEGWKVPSFVLALSLGLGALLLVVPNSLMVIYNGLVLWHYFIDGRIWRFSSSPELAPLLKS